MATVAKRILWVDDEVELLEPHLLFLRQRGYQVDTTSNGDDALALVRRQAYDLLLLDEQMPGQRGLEVLEQLRREEPHARVVMVTKSEEDRTLQEAIGRRVDDYLVKPASPRQVLSVVARLLEGPQLQQQRAAQDFAARFLELSRLRDEARGWREYFALYDELVDWDLRLTEAGEPGLRDSVTALLTDLRRSFGLHVAREYARWVGDGASRDGGWRGGAVAAGADRPPLSTDVVSRFLVPLLRSGPVLFMIIDCLRLDQWRVLRQLLAPYFELNEELYASILPTATPYARNALFSGLFPDMIARARPEWWGTDEGSLNAFEDHLFREQLRKLTGRDVPVFYEKVFSDAEADELVGRVRGALKGEGVIALVFNFVDLLTHGRSESAILMEVARDVQALRSLTRQWFERSAAFRVLREAAAQGVPGVLTTDHGSIPCTRPLTVYARRDATANLRYKFGADLRAEDPSGVFAVNDERCLRFPPGRMAINYLLALEDHFFVYPTKLREYQARYRGSFLHGGVSPEEMILPVTQLRPRTGVR
ncbi:MAG: bifunctional response regulator/alkaline phosphatase family protein [Gemmatimonadetes bacterium]|nr:bifunctional response regulator/alkaline phosphatase family protein [Gemmatimonadota bacterium]